MPKEPGQGAFNERKPSLTYSYVFIFSGPPVPRLIERVHAVVDSGHKVAVAYLKRPGAAVKPGKIHGADLIPLPVPFRAAGLDRIAAFPRLFQRLKERVLKHAFRDAFIYIDSLDILAATKLTPCTSKMSIRYEVRDLHRLQLSRGFTGWLVRLAERHLVSKIDHLIVTSDAYFESYYKSFYRRPVTLLENIPDRSVWHGFQPKRAKQGEPIIVGLIGAIRYSDCVLALMQGARLAREKGIDVRLKIAGPDMEGRLSINADDHWIERSGPFDYVEEVKTLYSDLDLIWSVYDTRIHNVRLALSNKLYESIMSGIPIVAAEGTHLSSRINELGIGISVADRSAESISNVLATVRTGKWYVNACKKLDHIDAYSEQMSEQLKIAEQKALFDRVQR